MTVMENDLITVYTYEAPSGNTVKIVAKFSELTEPTYTQQLSTFRYMESKVDPFGKIYFEDMGPIDDSADDGGSNAYGLARDVIECFLSKHLEPKVLALKFQDVADEVADGS